MQALSFVAKSNQPPIGVKREKMLLAIHDRQVPLYLRGWVS
jgi:hypothetical protein